MTTARLPGRIAVLSLGCDMAQGYFISRPAPYEAFVSWLTNTKTCARHCEDPSRVQLSHPFCP